VNRRTRAFVFLFAGGALGVLLLWGFSGLPAFGHGTGDYASILNSVSVPERHITDVVTAVNFDYRGFDTLGEEFIFFAAVAGVLVLLRSQPNEGPGHVEDVATGRHVPQTSDAVRVLGLALVGPTVLFGLYVVTHGHLTPGGGFQGGVVLATGVLLIYLAGEYSHMRSLYPRPVIEGAEAVGAAAFILIGLAGLVGLGGGVAFLDNFLPLGRIGQLPSAGFVPLLNASVGVEIAAGFVLLLMAFLEQTLVLRERHDAGRGGGGTLGHGEGRL
jgi:multicomponent Na+:H+ antiporter subunit B